MNKFWRRYRRLIFIAALFLLPIATLILGKYPMPRLNIYDRVSSWVVYPFAEGIGNLGRGAGVLWKDYVALIGKSKENEELKKITSELREKILSLEEAAQENERLRKLLDFPTAGFARRLPAKVIGEDASFESNTLVINIGTREGVAVKMPVVTSEGVVGTVVKVFHSSALVQTVIDPSHDLDATVSRSRARFLVEGKGTELLGRLKYLDRADDIRVGDVVLTSGVDGVFPAGLRIGHIVRVRRPQMGVIQNADLRPSVDIGTLEEVLVLDREGTTL